MAACIENIRIIPLDPQGAAGHRTLILAFNNVSTTTTCSMSGYPGVDLIDSNGNTVVHLAQTLRGMAGGLSSGLTVPQTVVLPPGGSASALVEATSLPPNGYTSCGEYNLLVTPPGMQPGPHISLTPGPETMPGCEAQVHPVVAGMGGGLGNH